MQSAEDLVEQSGVESPVGGGDHRVPGDPTMIPNLPLPPMKYRKMTGPTEDEEFDNPRGIFVWGDLAIGPLTPGQAYERVFDFGCGCGRHARQLLLQHQPPRRYVGIDINRQMIQWCVKNLQRPSVEVTFDHHDVWSPVYAPDNSRNSHLPIRHYGDNFTIINAHSVFTHLFEAQSRHYLTEMRQMLAAEGMVRCTWFFFSRDWFPMLAPQQHTLFVSEFDPTQAVYYDWEFFKGLARELGFKIVDVEWTDEPGCQSAIYLAWGDKFEDRAATIEPPDTVLGFGHSAPPSVG